jgi:hypothetical protein
MRATIIAVAGLLAVTACGSPVAPERAAPPAGVEVHCPASADLPAAEQPLPAGFTAVAALRCGDELRDVPGEGTWWFRVAERADTDAAALLAALRRPDEVPPAGGVCASIGFVVPYFALVDASGTVVRPRVPRDGCQEPQKASLDALAKLPFREVTATRRNQERSQESIDTGCGQMWTDAFAGDTLAHTRPAADRRTWAKTPDAVQICVWRPGSGMPTLESAGTVRGPELTALLARLDHLPAASCTTPSHQRFAVLQYVRHGWDDDALYTELDGCGLALRPDHTLGHLDPATAAQLLTLAH